MNANLNRIMIIWYLENMCSSLRNYHSTATYNLTTICLRFATETITVCTHSWATKWLRLPLWDTYYLLLYVCKIYVLSRYKVGRYPVKVPSKGTSKDYIAFKRVFFCYSRSGRRYRYLSSSDRSVITYKL